MSLETTIKNLSDSEIIALLTSESTLNKMRKRFSGWCGRIEQAELQQKPIGPIELRRMEFQAVVDIIEIYKKSLENS